MNYIPGLSLRASEEDEIMGIDDAEIGEFAVCFPRSSCWIIALDSMADRLCSMTTLRSLAMSFPRLKALIPWIEARRIP